MCDGVPIVCPFSDETDSLKQLIEMVRVHDSDGEVNLRVADMNPEERNTLASRLGQIVPQRGQNAVAPLTPDRFLPPSNGGMTANN